MTFTIESLLDSLAGVLKGQYPDCPVYTSPNQQGTEFPCFFIFFTTPVTVEPDIVFVQQRNIASRNVQIYEVAEFLDEKLELFPYTDADGNTALIRTEERQWNEEDDELHYQFHIRQRVSLPEDETKMRKMEGNYAGVKD